MAYATEILTAVTVISLGVAYFTDRDYLVAIAWPAVMFIGTCAVAGMLFDKIRKHKTYSTDPTRTQDKIIFGLAWLGTLMITDGDTEHLALIIILFIAAFTCFALAARAAIAR